MEYEPSDNGWVSTSEPESEEPLNMEAMQDPVKARHARLARKYENERQQGLHATWVRQRTKHEEEESTDDEHQTTEVALAERLGDSINVNSESNASDSEDFENMGYSVSTAADLESVQTASQVPSLARGFLDIFENDH